MLKIVGTSVFKPAYIKKQPRAADKLQNWIGSVVFAQFKYDEKSVVSCKRVNEGDFEQSQDWWGWKREQLPSPTYILPSFLRCADRG